MIIALLAIFVLAGMVFFVYNMGDQVNRRVMMQNAADSAAISGGQWMARSMNVVAMNNVAQSRLIGLVPVLDSLPLATEMSYEEVTEWLRGLDAQIDAGTIQDSELLAGPKSMTERFRRQQIRLQPLYEALAETGYDVREATYWRHPSGGGQAPYGRLWIGAKALEEFNEATIESAGLLAQANGAGMGKKSSEKSGHDRLPANSFILPVLPELPAYKGEFRDFDKPVRKGRPAEWEDNSVGHHYRRGPYDQLFKWRYPLYDPKNAKRIKVGHVQGTAGPVRGGPGYSVGGKSVGTSVVGGPRDHDIWKTISYGPQIGWSTYGVYSWMLHGRDPSSGLSHYAGHNLADTNFMKYLRQLADAKLKYMFESTNTRTIHKPRWISVFPEAREIAEAGTITTPGDPDDPDAPDDDQTERVEVKYTLFYMVQTKSKFAPDTAGYKTPGTYETNAHDPKAHWVNGWENPEDWENDPARKAVKIADHVWQIDWEYQTTFDEDIGLPRSGGQDSNGDPVWHTVYIREQYVFGGIDVGETIDIRNPANFQASDDLPKPYLLDHKGGAADYEGRDQRRYFAYLGLARMNSSTRLWRSQFDSSAKNVVNHSVTAMAEAQVFNNQSWDLWTQAWETRLRPIKWERWIDELERPNPADLQAVRQYLPDEEYNLVRAILLNYDREMAEALLMH
jgi:hypothetical protein